MGVTRGGERPRVTFRTGGFHSSDEDESHAFLPDSTSSSSSDGEEAHPDHALSAPIAIPQPTLAPTRPPPSPLVQRNAKRSLGQKHICKRGRRSRQRFDEERRMLAQFVDPEDEQEAFTIVRESNSHFRLLLEDAHLLDKFVTEAEELEEPDQAHNRGHGRRKYAGSAYDSEADSDSASPDPESAYLSISANIRVAIKKHLPLGMVESLEDDIRSFFVENPNSVYEAGNLSSYERLLAHACCSYNRLISRSFDEEDGGSRRLRVENPLPTFRPTDPRLSVYLRKRAVDVRGKPSPA